MHRHRIREIAEQAGLSEATVDRALNGRAGVRASTVAQVQRAVTELDQQRDQVQLGGRSFLVDLVMQAPHRFSSTVQKALERTLPELRPAVVRSRFHLREEGSPAALVQILDSIGRRGSAGVILKAPEDPDVNAAVDRLYLRGIPVVALVTDLPLSRRVAYVGMDNLAAGATAAYLVHELSRGAGQAVLITLSRSTFRGEDERETGFRATLSRLDPSRRVVDVTETDGLDASMLAAVAKVLAVDAGIGAVYSIGGGNTATLEAFHRVGRRAAPFIAHDLDADNTMLLRQHRINAVLHHDLPADLRTSCRIILRAQGALPGPPLSIASQIQVVTPYNLPIN